MNARDIPFQRRRQNRQESFNDYSAPNNFVEGNSFVGNLERKIQYQNQTINNLIKAFEDSRLEQQKQLQYLERLKQVEEQKHNLQILEELKTLKHKIKKIEQSPPIQTTPQVYQQPYLPPIPSQFQPGMLNFQSANQINPFIQNPFIQQSQQFHQPYLNSDQVIQRKKPRQIDTLHKFLLKMLSEKEEEKKKQKKNTQDDSNQRYITDIESSQQLSSKRRTLKSPLIVKSRKHRQSDITNSEHQAEDITKNYERKQSQLSKQTQQSQPKTLGQGSEKQSQKKFPIITKMRMKELMIKFKGAVRYFWLAKTLLKFCQKIWNQNLLIFKDWSQEQIGQYDPQFNYLQVISQFYRECALKKSMDKSWVFTQTLDVQIRCQTLLTILEIFFRYLIIQTVDFNREHIAFMKKISLKNGYFLAGHSKYVSSRLNLRPNNTLNIETPEQSQMILMEYSFIQILLPLIVEADYWKKLVNYKEALKIFISVLHYLFIDKFYSLPASKQQLPFNKEFVPSFDFTRNPVEGFYQLIDSKHAQYIETTNDAVLGLYSKAQLHPLILHVGFKKIQENFKQYCDLIYNLIL